MSTAIKVSFEIGHVASLRSKQTPEGFTHDWEVFLRGAEGAEISHFVEKVVFNLHTTFKKPRRVVKEPPFSVKESGYAGFTLPIEIYLKNKSEPKKIQFSYEFTLQQSGLLRDRYIFQNPNDEFRKKLFKGGGIPVSNESYYTNPDQESRSRDSFTEEKQQLVSKPKLSIDNIKKHKSKEHKDEVPHRTSSFENLFGPPLQKPPKVSPDPKKNDKVAPPVKTDKKDKERSSSDKRSKHEHKDNKPDKIKVKEDKDKGRSDKIKVHSKDQEKSKEKSVKRPNERPPSPDVIKKQRIASPLRRVSSPSHSNSASSTREEYKQTKHISESVEQKKPKGDEKLGDGKVELKEKKKKEKKSHSREKERKEKKEHKKESHKSKESPKEPPKEIAKEVPKGRDVQKEREPSKDSPTLKNKTIKPEKTVNKFSMENLRKTTPETEDIPENHKQKDKSDPRKHKHKKKDKKRDESREKHKDSSKEKKHKHDKVRDIPPEKVEVRERDTPTPKERVIPELASPVSIDTASQCSSKSGLVKTSHINNENANSSHSESDGSIMGDDDDTKVKVENISPEPVKQELSPEPDPEVEPDPEIEPETEPEPEPTIEPPVPKEKSKKHKDKSAKKEEKRRKRKAAEEERDSIESKEHRKSAKTSETTTGPPVFNDMERGESSGSTSAETKVQDNGVSSSLGEDAEPGELSPDYMLQLRDLQQRIMKIKNNEELERVVNLISETGRFEVNTETFDFDLCLLEKSTVEQLIRIVGC